MANMYSDMGRFLQESFSIAETFKKSSNKKLDESLNESNDYSHVQPGTAAMLKLAETVDEHDLLVEIIQWLPDDTLAKMAEDFRNTWDLDDGE